MTSTDSFTEQDRLDHDDAIGRIRANANGTAHRVWLTGKDLIMVRERRLFGVSGLDRLGPWTKQHCGFEQEHADDYIRCYTSLPEEFVKGRDISQDGLLVIVRAEGDVQEALMKHVGRGARERVLSKARQAGEAAERAGEDIEQAVKDAFAGLPYSGSTVPPIQSLKKCVNTVLRRTGKDGDLMEMLLGKVQAGEELLDETLWVELSERVDRISALKEELLMALGNTAEAGVPVPQPVPQKAAPPPSPVPPQDGPVPEGSSRRAPDRDDAGREGRETAPEQGQNAGGIPFETRNPAKSHEPPPQQQGSPPEAASAAQPQVLTSEQVKQMMVQTVNASLTVEEKQQLEGHMYKLLCGRPVPAVTITFLRELYQPCLREAPELQQGVFDHFVGALLHSNFEYRWEWAFSFFLSAKLDGYIRHLELLTTYEDELPEKYLKLLRQWDWNLHFDPKAILAQGGMDPAGEEGRSG